MKYLRLGYAMNPALSTVTAEDVQRLTHINLAFGRITDGVLDLYMLPDIELIRQYKKWNPELKLVLSVGGWGGGGFSGMAMTEAGRRAFAASCLDAVKKYDLDGIDIDWEYPCSDVAGIDADPRDKENFTLLLQALRDALGCEKIVSVAVGADESCIRNTEMDKVAAILDYIQLMTYDMVGAFSGVSGHHAALGATRGDTSANNTRATVALYHAAGVPYEKMVVGAAFYGRHFEVQSVENNGLMQPSGPGLPGPSYGELTGEYVTENGYQRFWDEDAEAAYLFNGSTMISYESPEAIRRKCEFVKEKGIKGIMYWEHSNDLSRELLGVIAETLGD